MMTTLNKDSDIQTRYYQPGDEDNIVKLLKKTFPKWAEFKDPNGLWRWKYIDTPLKNHITLALVGNEIVGCNHAVVFKAKLGNETTTLGYNDDLAVDSDYRGLGISSKMNKKKYETLPSMAKYVISTSINPIVISSWVKTDRALLPFQIARMIKTNDINLLLETQQTKNKALAKLGYHGLKHLNKIANIFKKPLKKSNEITILKINSFENNIDTFWIRIRDDYNFILEKNQEYLNWRYTDNDRGKHIIFQAMKGDEVLGYVVLGYKPGSSEGQIVDLLALKNRLDVVDSLLKNACDYFDTLGINTIYYQVVAGHPYQELCTRRGFLDSRSRPNVVFDYSVHVMGGPKMDIPFLEHTTPSQVDFTYSTTI